MKGFSKMLSLVLLLAIFIIGSVYAVAILGATDNGVDMSGSELQDQYNSSTDIQQTGLTLFSFVTWIVVIALLVTAVMLIKKSIGG